MTLDELLANVRITRDGAIGLKSVVCDGFESGYHAAAFTHAHSDHASDRFESCMHRYNVYVSKTTRDLLEAIRNDTYRGRTQLHTLDYGSPTPINYDGKMDYLTLYRSEHMLGSSQVFLEMHDGTKLLYSGDISPEDYPQKCDVLVMDSTHGDSSMFDKAVDSRSLEERLHDAVMGAISEKKPVCIHAHRGQLQHIMGILSSSEDIPSTIQFLATPAEIRVAAVYSKYGPNIRKLVPLESYDADEIIYENYPWIEFSSSLHLSERERVRRMIPITVAGRPGKVTMTQDQEKYWIVSNAHAEFSQLLDYVRKASPRAVITDNTRGSCGEKLAEQIRTKLGIHAVASPMIQHA